jgi:hypothetical protein
MQSKSEKTQKNTKKAVGRPRKSSTWNAEALNERADRYFAQCDSRTKAVITKEGLENIPAPKPYTVEGLCVYLKIDRRLFAAWRKRSDDLGKAAELLHERITANRIEGALDGRQHPGFAQFLLKNNDPEYYRDKVEVENTVAEDAKAMFEQWSHMWKIQQQ